MTTWHIAYDGGTAFVAGPKAEARRRIAAAGDPSPLWVARRNAWATSTAAATAVLNQLDARNIPATVEDTAQAAITLDDTQAANALPEGGLW